MRVEIYRGYHFLEFKDPFNLPGLEWVKKMFGKGAAQPVKRYCLNGYIRFDFTFRWEKPEPPADLNVLRQAILAADEAAPWKSSLGQSIRYLSPGLWLDCQSNECAVFQINPPDNTMTQPQLYAYEKYLAVLAQTLAEKKIPGVESVLSAIEASTSQRFMAPHEPQEDDPLTATSKLMDIA